MCNCNDCDKAYWDAFNAKWDELFNHKKTKQQERIDNVFKELKQEKALDNRDKEINLLEMAERGELPDILDACVGWVCIVANGKLQNPGKLRLAQLKAEKEKESRKVFVEKLSITSGDNLNWMTISADAKSLVEISEFLREKYGAKI